jgi:hypothetical protein
MFLQKPFFTQKPKYNEKENVKTPQVEQNQNRVSFNVSTKLSPGYRRHWLLERSADLRLLRANLHNEFVLI